MNAGTKTIRIAHGIYLWAQVQAYSPNGPEYLKAERTWLQFTSAMPKSEIDFIKREQYRLFDQVNNYL